MRYRVNMNLKHGKIQYDNLNTFLEDHKNNTDINRFSQDVKQILVMDSYDMKIKNLRIILMKD